MDLKAGVKVPVSSLLFFTVVYDWENRAVRLEIFFRAQYSICMQEFQSEFCCGRYEHIAHLEARIRDQEEKNPFLW